jgi:hypothetical protein
MPREPSAGRCGRPGPVAEPGSLIGDASLDPDAWQGNMLRPAATQPLLLGNCQAGKSAVAAALAHRTALLEPGSLTLLLSPRPKSAERSTHSCGASVNPERHHFEEGLVREIEGIVTWPECSR